MTEALVKTSLCLATRSSSKYLRIVAVEAPWFAVERRGGAVVRRAAGNRRLDPLKIMYSMGCQSPIRGLTALG